jgi:hypothetical protein
MLKIPGSWPHRRAKFEWTCPACQAVNSDPHGLCAVCAARIDPEYIQRQIAASSGTIESEYGSLPGRPRLLGAAIGLMIVGILLEVVMAVARGVSGTDWVGIVASGLVTVWFINAFLSGIDWARKLYLLMSIGGFMFGMLMSPSTTPLTLIDPVRVTGVVVTVIFLLPSVSDWFRRS